MIEVKYLIFFNNQLQLKDYTEQLEKYFIE